MSGPVPTGRVVRASGRSGRHGRGGWYHVGTTSPSACDAVHGGVAREAVHPVPSPTHYGKWRTLRQHRFSVHNYDGWQQSWPYGDPARPRLTG